MIYGFTHLGSGLGNQLHRYLATRVLALDKGYDFSIIGKGYFKGSSFMKLDFGKELNPHPMISIEEGGKIQVREKIPLWEEKTNYYNPEFNFIEDNTIIDGEFQDERYFGHRLKEIDEWLYVEPLDIPDDVCVIGFRGGEFKLFPELFLSIDYWEQAIVLMKEKNPNMRFEIHTDDVETATNYFWFMDEMPPVIHDIGTNWRSMRYANHAIIANSSFYILPRLLRHNHISLGDWKNRSFTIAPRYWARRNTKEWSMPQNYYKSFKYI